MQSKIFLDTTIQIERLTATRTRQMAIAKVLNGKHIVTSSYVLGEYLRTLVNDAVQLFELINATESTYDVETQIANLMNKRSARRCLLLWTMYHRSGIYDHSMMRKKLDNDIEYGLVNRFMLGIDEFLDTTCCGLAKERPMLGEETYQLRTQCTRRVKECELVALLQKYKPKIQLLADGLKNHSDRSLVRISKLCTLILEDPDVARGRNCTWYLGDLVIALEAPKDTAIYTSNLRHFEPICELLGKKIYRSG